jgi:hypothetical protein
MNENNDLATVKGVWITWEHQIRNQGLSKAFGYILYEIDLDSKYSLWKRYVLSILKTILIVFREKPGIVVVQNPSIFLGLLAVIIQPFFKYKLVMDAHNSGIYPFNNKYQVLNHISRFLQRCVTVTIVTNQTLAEVVTNNGGRVCILPDVLPEVPAALKKVHLDGRINIVFICSYHDDEPYMEVIQAARQFEDDTVFYITGNHKGRIRGDTLGSNVRLTGFIPVIEYWSLLNSADIIMDLTTRENCLVCGAYESVALFKPMILSDTTATKEYFSIGAVYTKPTVTSIVDSVNEAIKKFKELSEQVQLLNRCLRSNWNMCLERCKTIIGN